MIQPKTPKKKGRKKGTKKMLKPVLFFLSLLKTVFFKSDKQYNIKSKEFDMLKD